jgi:hypothetical protein
MSLSLVDRRSTTSVVAPWSKCAERSLALASAGWISDMGPLGVLHRTGSGEVFSCLPGECRGQVRHNSESLLGR